jgi:hypothetical protein
MGQTINIIYWNSKCQKEFHPHFSAQIDLFMSANRFRSFDREHPSSPHLIQKCQRELLGIIPSPRNYGGPLLFNGAHNEKLCRAPRPSGLAETNLTNCAPSRGAPQICSIHAQPRARWEISVWVCGGAAGRALSDCAFSSRWCLSSTSGSCPRVHPQWSALGGRQML